MRRPEDEYIEIAVKLANDKDRLREIRRGMRQRLLASPLLDGATTPAISKRCYRQIWKNGPHRRVIAPQDQFARAITPVNPHTSPASARTPAVPACSRSGPHQESNSAADVKLAVRVLDLEQALIESTD